MEQLERPVLPVFARAVPWPLVFAVHPARTPGEPAGGTPALRNHD